MNQRPSEYKWPHCGLCRTIIEPKDRRYRLMNQNRGGSRGAGVAQTATPDLEIKLALTLCSKCGRKVIRVIERESAVVEAQEIIASG